MSIQAVGWALEQDLPARPKLVLVSIANHADHRTGYCYLRADTIADEASCSVRGVYNFIGDLVRNGFVRRTPKKGDDGKQRANDYWILFDRTPVEWSSDRAAGAPDDDGEPFADDTISGEPTAPGAVGEEGSESTSEPVETAHGAVGPHASTCSRIDSEEPSKSNPEKSEPENRFAAPPRRYRPPPPVPQGATHTVTTERIFVYKGTPAWDAWMKYRKDVERKNDCHTYRKHVDGVGWREGWDFPSLFPPRRETEKESGEEASGTDPPQKPA